MSLVHWIYVDLNSYFASVEQHLNPKLRGKPIAVVPMIADSTSVIAASYEAKKYGIRTGTRVSEAKILCPSIVLVAAEHHEYVNYHKKIVTAVECCHPITSVHSIDEMACALGGRDQKVENALNLAKEIKARILRDVGVSFTCSIGIATNRFLAKVASDMEKPNGLVTILPADIPEKLYSLNLRDLIGIGPNMEARLNRQGVKSVQRLYELSVQEMRSIWGGVGGERFYKWIRGENLEISHNSNQSLSHQHVLPPHLRSYSGAYMVGQKLLHKAGVRLRKINAWTKHLSVTVKFVDGTYWWNELKTLECQDTLTLQEAFDQLWKTFRESSTPIKVTVALTQLIPNEERNFSFFDETDRITLSHLMDAINLKYGRDTIHLGSIHDALDSAPTRIAFSSIPDFNI